MPEGPPETGLALRMKGEALRISSQHRQLDDLYAPVASALDRGDQDGARAAFARFADALEAHLALEDTLYFPALHGLERRLEGDLAGLCAEHTALRTGMAGIAECLANASSVACAAAISEWVAELAEHERREESLLERLRGGRFAAGRA